MNFSRLATAASAAVLALAIALSGCGGASSPSVPVHLDDSPTATQFAQLLPQTFAFSDRLGGAAVASIRVSLDTPVLDTIAEYTAGDVAYRADDSSVYVLLSDGVAPSDVGLVLLGRVDDLAPFWACPRTCEVALTVG